MKFSKHDGRARVENPPHTRTLKSGRRCEFRAAADGVFTPLRSLMAPPTSTTHSTNSSPLFSTVMRSLPSSMRSVSPLAKVAMISGCGSSTRDASPGSSSRSNRNFWPALRSTLSWPKTPTRSFGPWRSARIPIGWPYFASTCRMSLTSSAFSSWAPWLKLRRKTSTPARKSFSSMASVDDAGPSVASCFVAFFHRSGAPGSATGAVVVGAVSMTRTALGGRR